MHIRVNDPRHPRAVLSPAIPRQRDLNSARRLSAALRGRDARVEGHDRVR